LSASKHSRKFSPTERIAKEEEIGEQGHHVTEDKTEHEEYFSPSEGTKTGGAAKKRGTSSIAFTSEDVSRSPADPEDVYASQNPEECHEVSSPI